MAKHHDFCNKKVIIPIFFVSILWFLYGGQRWKIVAVGNKASLATNYVKNKSYIVFARSREPPIKRRFFKTPQTHAKKG